MRIGHIKKGELWASNAFTLIEVMVSLAIAALLVAGTIYGYLVSGRRAEWSCYSLAAHSIALQRLEQVQACKWDLTKPGSTGDQLNTNNFPKNTVILDTPRSGTNVIWATNFTTITNVSTNPWIKSIRVDCVWYFTPRKKLFTNTIVSYRAPD